MLSRNSRKGLAYFLGETEYGGKLCAIEAIKRSYTAGSATPIKRGLLSTGSLGEVIKESIEIAYTFVRVTLE